ncbi:hypothetical protein FQN50_004148 [Emmonsiellopsis sp. PD_5]|nr:hypothetical protein FQN50_004148 [Emmonsiellopsis sp. PD_5]
MEALSSDTNTPPPPTALAYILSFLLVGVAWGFTTPFIRRAAVEYNNKSKNERNAEEGGRSWVARKFAGVVQTVVNLLSTPGYSVPLLLNLTGSGWFFLLVGRHELSLTVPITNSMAFLFTVLGEWYVEGKVISKSEYYPPVLVNCEVRKRRLIAVRRDVDCSSILLFIDRSFRYQPHLSFGGTDNKLEEFKDEVNTRTEASETRKLALLTLSEIKSGRIGLATHEEKVAAIKKLAFPRTLAQLEAGLGLFGYYREFIARYSQRLNDSKYGKLRDLQRPQPRAKRKKWAHRHLAVTTSIRCFWLKEFQLKFDIMQDNFSKMMDNQTQILQRLDAVNTNGHARHTSPSAPNTPELTTSTAAHTSRRSGDVLFGQSN